MLAWLLTLPFIVGAVGFALYNQTVVDIVISPFTDAYQWPVYIPVLAALAIGFVFGSLMTWAAMGRLRTAKRSQKQQIKILEKQLDTVSKDQVAAQTYLTAPLPPLQKRLS